MDAQTFKPSSQQQAVGDWVLNGKGSLELVARAGCGKTSTLLMVSKTIYNRNLGEIAIMAYNKAIANEVKEKTQEAGLTDWKKIQVGTVHSFGFSAWRKSAAPNLKVDDQKVYNLIDAHVQKDAHRCVYRDCGPTIYQAVGLAKQRAFGFLCEIEDRSQWF
jgi:superfamily I DNA/RNA helicase